MLRKITRVAAGTAIAVGMVAGFTAAPSAHAATGTSAAGLAGAEPQQITTGAALGHPSRPENPTADGTYLYPGINSIWGLGGLYLNNPTAYGLFGYGVHLYYQPDGNLVEYCNGDGYALWASNTQGATGGPNGTAFLAFQPDGNLVIYNNGHPIWSTRTNNHPNDYAVLQTDDNFVIYDGNNSVLWASNTYGVLDGCLQRLPFEPEAKLLPVGLRFATGGAQAVVDQRELVRPVLNGSAACRSGRLRVPATAGRSR